MLAIFFITRNPVIPFSAYSASVLFIMGSMKMWPKKFKLTVVEVLLLGVVTETTQFYLQRKWAEPYVALRENTKRVTRELSAWMSPLGLPALYKDFFLNLYWALLCYTKPGSNNDLLRRCVVISSSRCVLFNKPWSRFKSASPVQGIRDISD